jgi:hypothetical protein
VSGAWNSLRHSGQAGDSQREPESRTSKDRWIPPARE